MNPLSHHLAEVCAELNPYEPRLDAIFGIMGPYWYDTWSESALGHWYPKIIPFDMALDIRSFPRLKKHFNPPGRRKFLYIGWSGAQKGTHLLSILFGLTQKHQCVAIGKGPAIANVDHRPWRPFTADYVKELAEECDFLITMGVSDANPTTILEAMAWGFPVCCTPQSGYYNMAEISSLSITDMQKNLAVLDGLQFASESDLLARADAARQQVETHYTWDRFTSRLLTHLDELLERKNVGGQKSLNVA